jgi:hypothetical protein
LRLDGKCSGLVGCGILYFAALNFSDKDGKNVWGTLALGILNGITSVVAAIAVIPFVKWVRVG